MKRTRAPRLDVERVILPNGLLALLVENRSVPSVTIQAVVKAGERYVSDDLAGLAAATGTLLAHGTSQRDANAIAEIVESNGGRLRTAGGYATSQIELTLLSEDRKFGLDLVSELLRESVFREDRLQQVVDRRLGELKANEDDTRWVASTAFNEIVFTGSPQHRPTDGYAATISRLQRADVTAFHGKYFVPGNTLLVIAGDFEMREAIREVEEAFGSWSGATPLQLPEVSAPSLSRQPLRQVLKRDKEQVSIFLGHLGITRTDPDYFKVRVLDTILGDSPGFTSRIPRVLRDEQGLAYSVYCNMARSAGFEPGRFVAYIGTAPENLESALAGLHEQIDLITTEAPTAEEVESSKSYLTGSFVFEFETNAQLAAYLINAELYGLGSDYAERFLAEVDGVTPADVFSVARRHIKPDLLTEVIVGPVS